MSVSSGAASVRCCEANMPTASPKVSALVVTYNHARYIGAALDSIFAQTYPDYEVIVIDDGSIDGTPELIGRWPQVRYHYQQNQGLNAALNHALGLARGEYLALLAADDTWTPDRLARQVPILDARPELGLVYGDAMVIDEDGRPLCRFNEVYPVRKGDFATELFTHYCFVTAQALLVRRSCFERVGGFWGPTAISDYLKWIEIGIYNQAVYMDVVLGHYRRHQHNLTRANAGDFKYRSTLIGLAELLERHPAFAAQLGPRVDQRFSNIYFRNGVHHLMHGDATSAARLFGEALRRRPGYSAALAGLTSALLAPSIAARAMQMIYRWRVPYR
jgi:glycosyltransferase involved in cell wall biosynthesis